MEKGHRLADKAESGGPKMGQLVIDYAIPKKHGEGSAVNLTGRSGRPHVSFYVNRETVLRIPSGELRGRLP